jgi:hypothetical protein
MAKRTRKRNHGPPATFRPVPLSALSPEMRLAIGVGECVLNYVFSKLPKGVAVAGDKRDLKKLSQEMRSKIKKSLREQIAAANRRPVKGRRRSNA